MTSSILGRWTVGFAICLFLVASFGTRAVANIYLDLVVDPATTAFSGIPASGGFTGLSSRSGAGTWHLYALDDASDFGISSYQIKLNGSIPALNHRSPTTLWDDLDDNGPFTAGFDFSRTTANFNSISAAQNPIDSPKIGGLGQTASNFAAKLPAGASFLVTTNGQWGHYADFIPQSGALFLAEGTYVGSAPTIDFSNSTISYWTDAGLTTTATASQILPYYPCLCGISVEYAIINNVNANTPGFVTHTMSYFADLPQPGGVTWSDFQFNQYISPTNVSGPNPGAPATFDPSTHTFNWSTIGAPVGTYNWQVHASAQGYSSGGLISVHITAVPEPATLSLIGLATIAGGLILRRRA